MFCISSRHMSPYVDYNGIYGKQLTNENKHFFQWFTCKNISIMSCLSLAFCLTSANTKVDFNSFEVVKVYDIFFKNCLIVLISFKACLLS